MTIVGFALMSPDVQHRWLYVLFMLSHSLFRAWETFFTSKERNPHQFEGDWTLFVGTMAYIGLCFFITFEFFLSARALNWVLTSLGLILYFVAVRLRLWGQVSLGRQWAIHVVGQNKVAKRRLLRIGPYQFIRHPIYFGIALDELALPIIFNTGYAILFVGLVNWPLLCVRLFLEEKKSRVLFKDKDYVQYQNDTGLFFPRTFEKAGYFLRKIFFL